MIVAVLVLAAPAGMLVPAPSAAASVPADAEAFAAQVVRATPDERERLRRGSLVVKVLDSPDPTEVVAVAVVRVAPGADLAACARDARCLRRNTDLVEIGTFEGTPDAGDLNGLSLAANHESSLRRCQVGRCDLRLSQEAMDRVRGELEQKGAAAGQAALRESLAGYAAEYWTRGVPALLVFADRKRPISSADSMAELMQRPLAVLDAAPAVRAHLQRFPGPAPSGLQQYLYWYKEKFYRKVLLAVHHVVVGSEQNGSATLTVAASRQVYASNYMNATLEAVAVVSDGRGAAYLIHESRARSDVRASGFTWLERLILRRLVRGRMEDHLLALKARIQK
jgi:hypothetical protein